MGNNRRKNKRTFMKYFFSSDFHFGHKNVLKYDNRPFDTIEEHDGAIIRNYNNKVGEHDQFYFLGDFAFCNKRKSEEYISRLNGRKFFIKGNHDKKDTIKLYEKYGTYLGELKKIRIENQEIVLCHYGMRVWEGSHRGTWHLYGHSHHSLPPMGKSFDVGINGWNYEVLSFQEIETIMNLSKISKVDHHKI